MKKPTVRMLWGLAKCPELSLTDEELHLLVSAQTGKDSIRQLNQRELATVIGVLGDMKSSVRNGDRKTRGNTGTDHQRKKIYKLAEILGWDKTARINGFCKRMFKISCVEWLTYEQCSTLIEALKKMVERKEKQNG